MARKQNKKTWTDKSIPDIPAKLSQAIAEGKCAVFVGAGLSVAAGYPSWKDLLKALMKTAAPDGSQISAEQTRELTDLIQDNDKILLAAEEIRERLGPDIFANELLAIFKEKKKPTPTHLKLMDIPFNFAITTNYDLLLEKAYVAKHKDDYPSAYTNSQAPDISAALWEGKYFILKAHGDVNDRGSLVLTERDYRKLIYRSNGYRSALASIFTMNTIVFLGVSFSDPELKLLLGALHDAFHGSTTHFALVPKDEFCTTVTNRWRKDYGISCLPYQPSQGHPEVYEFVKALAKSTSK